MTEEFGMFMVGLGLGAALTLAVAPASCRADTWVVGTVASHHFEHPDTHNERNFGLGFETDVARDVRAIGGFYKNSNYRETVYAGAAWLPFRVGNFRLGAAGVLATGYAPYPVVPAIFGVVTYERQNWGVNLGFIPPASSIKQPAVLGLQFKLLYQ